MKNIYKSTLQFAIIFAAIISQHAFAATWNWTNTISGGADFTGTPGNWTNTSSPFASGTPASGDTGINNIAGSTTLIQSGDNISITALEANAGVISMTGGTLTGPGFAEGGTVPTIEVIGAGSNIISGGALFSGTFDVTSAGIMAISGGVVTNTGDSRITASGGSIDISGGALYLNDEKIGTVAGVVGCNVTASGNAVVNQNQTGDSLNQQLWVGANNGGSGTMVLENFAVWTNWDKTGGQVVVGRTAGSGETVTGVLTIQNSAVFVYSNAVIVAQVNSGGTVTGTVNLDGGNFICNGFATGGGTGIINVTNGVLTALANNANFFAGFKGTSGNNSVNLASGNLTFNDGGYLIGITNVLSGTGGLTKSGTGVVTNSVGSTYAGATTISAGKLVVTTASTGAGSYTIADGAALEVQVSASGQSLTNSSVTLGASGSLTANFTLNSFASTTVPVIKDNGALALNDTVTVNVSSSAALSGSSTYPLISYNSISGSGSFVAGTLPAVAGFTAGLTNDTVHGLVSLVYTPLPIPSLRWIGSVNGNWDTTDANWQIISNGSSSTYAEGDNVTFDDNAIGSSPITVTLTGSNHTPTIITNSSSTDSYIFAGSFSIIASSLVVDGGQVLTLDNGSGNSFTAVSIANGTLQVGNGDTGGSLGGSTLADSGTLAFNRTDTALVVTNVISGSGVVAQNGSGAVTLASANTYSGMTVINNGQLVVSNSAALQDSTVSNNVASGVTFASGITSATFGGLAGAGNIPLANSGGAAVTLVNGGDNFSTTYSGNLTVGTLQQAGTNSLALSGNSILNTAQVTGNGTLTITGGTSIFTNLQVVANNGSLLISGGTSTVITDSRIGAANGVYTVSGNATLNLNKFVIGSASSSNTNNLVTAAGSAIVVQNQTGGGDVQQLWVGGNNSGSGSLLLRDSAQWVNINPSAFDGNGNPIVAIGNNGTGIGTFTIQNTAAFTYSNVMQVAWNSGNVGTVNLNGGTVNLDGIAAGSGTATVNANGGTIVAIAASSSYFGNLTNVNIMTGGLTFNDNGNIVDVTNVLSGNGGLTKLGSGALALSGVNTFSGNTTIGAGSLALSGGGSIASPDIIVAGSATFDVSALSSAFTLGSGQVLSNSTSTAIINCGIGGASAGSGTLSLTYNPGTPSLLVTNGTLTLSASTGLTINNTGGALAAGTYIIITNDPATGLAAGTLPSSFTVTGGGIAAGATDSLQINNGALDLVVAPIPSSATITGISVSGTTLTMTATNGAVSGQYVLLESTNLLLPLNQWTPVLTNDFDGSGDLNLSTNIINPNTPLEFYLLQMP